MTGGGDVEAAVARAVELGERGVQVAAYLDGELVVDTWTGAADLDGVSPVDGDTLFPVFSVSKAFTAVAVHILVERGLVEYDAPLARYWPEYGRLGKEAITVRHVLIHRAGAPQMPEDVTVERFCDWDWMIRRLGELEPLTVPGTRNSYSGYVYGFQLAEVVQRVDPKGRPFGVFVREEICEPLGIDAFWIGLPESERSRVATLSYPNQPPPSPPESVHARQAPAQILTGPAVYNRPEIQAACIPAANGIGNARSVARLFAMLANGGELDGVRLLPEELVRSFLAPRPGGDDHDLTFDGTMAIGMGSLLRDPAGYIRQPPVGARVLSQFGAGGSLGYADLDAKLAFGFCHNRMFARPKLDGSDSPWAELGDVLRGLARPALRR
jgi:CubicO group peptidase (beta-lactamase class C family)